MNINYKDMETAVRDFNGWQGHACIMWDSEDGEVWTDVFASGEEGRRYHSTTIHCIVVKDNLYGRDEKYSAKRLRAALQAVIDTYDIDHPALVLTDAVTSEYYNPTIAARA